MIVTAPGDNAANMIGFERQIPMPVEQTIVAMTPEITSWRHHIHANPELLYDVHQTAAFVGSKLEEFGCDEVVTGIGQTGVVGVINGNRDSGKTLGLRADMDALPIEEIRDLPYRSQVGGVMHACGHDGHTAMLLGAAKYLAQSRNFDGRAVLVFQPAEEGGAGAKAMIDDGLMTDFDIDEIYGMHNRPGLPVGQFSIRQGWIHAAMDEFRIDIEGKGGHAAKPHLCIDPTATGAQIVDAARKIVNRDKDPVESGVLSITQFHSGDAFNVIPQTAWLGGTVRTFDPQLRDEIESRLTEVAETVAADAGAVAKVTYDRKYPAAFNHNSQTDFSVEVASDVVGGSQIDQSIPPEMGAEDFAFMLEERPGAIIFLGNGDTADHHNPMYDFNDEAIPYGTSYWIRLVEMAMPV